MIEILDKCTGFQWDKGNSEKNWEKHKVARNECEQVFFNVPLIIRDDPGHSENESRWYLLGQTDSSRFLFVVFTIRKELIRVISARDMNKKEKDVYNEQIKKYS
ncbi:MAG: BrnT family toxin [Calditrichaeota bacterium]|nr:MAG: BrnT family toxin [Calditrichota bacterium]MBL1206199.1 BrnT family toxin [Calditrichota bacterium]NOG46023.1 BrnT family toxin [Calditrichota bacterium]